MTREGAATAGPLLGDTIEVDLVSVAAGTGDAVARLDGMAVFVDDGLPGDRVAARIVERQKRFLRASMVEVLAPAPEAIEPACPHERACGGCRFQRAAYGDEVAWKAAATLESLRRIGRGVTWPDAAVVPDPAGPLGYRERTRMRVLHGGRTGYVAARSHRLIPIDGCVVLHPGIERARPEIEKLLQSVPRPGSVMLEWDATREQCAVTIEIETPPPPAQWDRLKRMARDLSLNISTVVFTSGRERAALTGDGLVLRTFGREHPVAVRCPTGGFSQANGRLNPTLVAVVCEAAQGARRVLELYGGAGNLTFPLLEQSAFVCSIEGAEPAIRAAEAAWRAHGEPGRARFVNADLTRGIPPAHRTTYDTIVADPPRGGMRDVLPHLVSSDAERVVYVSCDPAAMARDATDLVAGGFTVQSLTLIDMFPRTHHIEAVATFVRKRPTPG